MNDGAARAGQRLVSISRSGRFVAMRAGAGLEVVDAIGTAPRFAVPVAEARDFACVGNALWVLDGGALRRFTLDSQRELAAAGELPEAEALAPFLGEHSQAALLYSADGRVHLVAALADRWLCEEQVLAADERVFPLHGRRVAIAGARGLRLVEGARGEVARTTAFEGASVRAVAALFGGRALFVLAAEEDREQVWVLRPDGSLIHKLAVPSAERWTLAETRGVAVLAFADGSLLQLDLRHGRALAEARPPVTIADLDLDADGQYLVLAGEPEGVSSDPPVLHLPATEVFAGGSTRAAGEVATGLAEARPAGESSTWGHQLSGIRTLPAEDAAVEVPSDGQPADSRAAALEDATEEPSSVDPALPELLPLALGESLPPLVVPPHPDWPPYQAAHEHLEDLLDLVAARAAKAIADAWNSGRLSAPSDDPRPFEREVRALLGHVGGFAADMVQEASARLAAVAARSAGRARSSLAAGMRLPFVELSREFQLSSMAAQVLMVAVAPSVRGEIARLFGILGNDEHRPMVDPFLIEQIIAGADANGRLEVQRELAEDAPLLRNGLLRLGGIDRGAVLFGAISVDSVLIDRLHGRVSNNVSGGVAVLAHAETALEDLYLPRELVRELVLTMASRRSPEEPLRLVLRGRRGAGRHAVIAALAARIERGIVRIDCSRMPRSGKAMALALRQELFRALVRGCVPVASGLEVADPADAEGQELLKQVLRAHPGPVILRTSPEGAVPLDPGYQSFTIAPLSESERAVVWRQAVARAGLPVGDPDALAARYRVGPGVIEHVISQVAARRAHEQTEPDLDAGAQLEEMAGQHIATRLSHIATRVRRLPRWEQVALPGDIIDSIREFVARISQRKTVYETWGFDEKMSTSRGLTALFYGPPGTGKTMVAGLIARELGLELYRIDLARIVSKWIGETEKNLAEVFDAAEDGQVVLVFDEADSLFAKRTEVKSSVDRYANLEVNYLLQRLDTFEGIAILTTNLEGSIDPAFKRRMSLRLQFPFPDEEMRVRLWASHLPSAAPVAGDFDFAELARRFPLSGGYIRNSTLRAAFLAAQERRPLSQEHLLRAIALEYRELGKLSTSGRME